MINNINDFSILCTICARGGSKGVKNKNIKMLYGKPLIVHTIEQAKAANIFKEVIISTDSDQIADISKKAGGSVIFKRPESLAGDQVGKLSVIKHALLETEKHFCNRYDYIVDLDATSPLRYVSDIINSIELFLKKGYSNLITAAPARRSPYFNLIELNKQGYVKLSKPLNKAILRRQDSPPCFDMNASIYIWNRDELINNNTIFLKNTGLYIMPEERSIDIDNELDFQFVEFLLKRRGADKND